MMTTFDKRPISEITFVIDGDASWQKVELCLRGTRSPTFRISRDPNPSSCEYTYPDQNHRYQICREEREVEERLEHARGRAKGKGGKANSPAKPDMQRSGAKKNSSSSSSLSKADQDDVPEVGFLTNATSSVFISPLEACIRRYAIFLQITQSEQLLGQLARLPASLLEDPLISEAIDVFTAFQVKDYSKFLKFYRECDFLSAVALSGRVDYIRYKSVVTLVRSMHPSLVDRIPLDDVLQSLCLDSDRSYGVAFLEHLGLSVQSSEELKASAAKAKEPAAQKAKGGVTLKPNAAQQAKNAAQQAKPSPSPSVTAPSPSGSPTAATGSSEEEDSSAPTHFVVIPKRADLKQPSRESGQCPMLLDPRSGGVLHRSEADFREAFSDFYGIHGIRDPVLVAKFSSLNRPPLNCGSRTDVIMGRADPDTASVFGFASGGASGSRSAVPGSPGKKSTAASVPGSPGKKVVLSPGPRGQAGSSPAAKGNNGGAKLVLSPAKKRDSASKKVVLKGKDEVSKSAEGGPASEKVVLKPNTSSAKAKVVLKPKAAEKERVVLRGRTRSRSASRARSKSQSKSKAAPAVKDAAPTKDKDFRPPSRGRNSQSAVTAQKSGLSTDGASPGGSGGAGPSIGGKSTVAPADADESKELEPSASVSELTGSGKDKDSSGKPATTAKVMAKAKSQSKKGAGASSADEKASANGKPASRASSKSNSMKAKAGAKAAAMKVKK